MDLLNFVSVKIEQSDEKPGPNIANVKTEKPEHNSEEQIDKALNPDPLQIVSMKLENETINSEIVLKDESIENALKETNTTELKYKCNICTKPYKHESSLLRHQKLHLALNPDPSQIVSVKLENETINSEIVLKDESIENALKETNTTELKYKCNICTKPYKHESSLLRHQKLHLAENQCKICGKPFKNGKLLEKHVKKHYREKLTCKLCDKTFDRQSYLKRHENAHYQIKPFKCDSCDKAFTQRAYLKNHERKHTGERPYKCRFCAKDFALSDSLRSHERIHTGEKPYSCKYCDKSMADGSALRRHERSHTGKKPYKCKFCGKELTRSFGLRKHLKKHSGNPEDYVNVPEIKPFKCILCPKEFKRNNALKFHVRDKHLQPDDSVSIVHTYEIPTATDGSESGDLAEFTRIKISSMGQFF